MLVNYQPRYYTTLPPRVDQVASGSWVMNCCGASYSKAKSPRKTNTRGIRIFAGLHFKEENTDTTQITHVKTRNGNITVYVRKS